MRKKVIALIMVCVTLLSACGRQAEETEQEHSMEQTGEQNDGGEEKASRWEFRETFLPDAEEALYAAIPGLGKAWEETSGMVEGSLYRVVSLSNEELVDMGTCIQILEPPYTEWENIYLSNGGWLDGQSSYARKVAIQADGSVCLLLAGLGDGAWYRARWSREDGAAVERIPEECLSARQLRESIRNFYIDGQGRCYIVSEDRVWYFDKDSTEPQEWKIAGEVELIAENPLGGQVCLFGSSSEGEPCIWTEGEAAPVLTFDDSQLLITNFSSKVAFGSEAEGVLCNESGIWKFSLQNGSTENLLDFIMSGYDVERVYGICAGEDGTLQVAAFRNGRTVLMEGRQGSEAWSEESREQVELELAVSYAGISLKEIIVNYNMRSENCRIVLRERGEDETRDDYLKRIQMEISTGGGPDILADNVIDFQNAVEKGILRDLTEDLAEQMADIPENILGLGEAEGRYYAIPYCFSVLTLVTSADIVGDREGWTPEELVQCVRSGDAQTAVANLGGSSLFNMLVLRGNLIDWENGKSNLNGAEAVALLEAAGEYYDKRPYEERGSRLAEGEILANYDSFRSLMDMRTMEAMYQGREVYIGLPREDGKNGNILQGNTFSVNQSCKYPEEAIAFIQYLLSEENQWKLAGGDWSSNGFPVNSMILEKMFEEERKLSENPNRSLGVVQASYADFEYVPQPLSEESLEKARKLLLNAEPETEERDFVFDIIAEEAPAYFEGDKSAQSVCDIIQNRVQLYLDERN